MRALGEWCELPVTYAGGARELGDLDLVDRLSNGKVDLTFGSYVLSTSAKGTGTLRVMTLVRKANAQLARYLWRNRGRV